MGQEDEALERLRKQAFKEKVAHLAKKHNVATEQVLGLFEEELKLAREHWGIFFPQSPNKLDEQKVLVDHFLFRVVNARLVAEKAEEEAALDHLTQIPNRRALDLALEKYVANFQRSKHDEISKPFSIIFFDLDDFKGINDYFGHDTGDEALKKVAEVAQSNIRPVDFIARYGGEEFVIIFNGEVGDAAKLAERIRETLLNIDVSSLGINPKSHAFISASFGVATHDETNESSVLKRANLLMKKAKGNGKNHVVVDK